MATELEHCVLLNCAEDLVRLGRDVSRHHILDQSHHLHSVVVVVVVVAVVDDALNFE